MEIFDNSILGRILSTDEEDSQAENCQVKGGVFPKETPPTMAYVPFQTWETPYEKMVGFERGTIFPSLDKPFVGEEAVRHG